MKKLIILYIKLRYFTHIYLGIKLPGLGYVQNQLKQPFVFQAFGKSFKYDPNVKNSYDYLLIGKSNEPETQLFFNKIFLELEISNFVDVGASIGEFVNFVSNYPSVASIYAFEIRPNCVLVLKDNKDLNRDKRIKIFQNAVSNKREAIKIFMNPGGTSSGIYSLESDDSINFKGTTTILLDDILPNKLKNTVLLIDVEGAEPLVIKGGKEFIDKNSPLIVFEYNLTSKKHFNIKDIKEIIGDNYKIHSIRADGSLDTDFSNSWNCVAIPKDSQFEKILLK